jgi:hypothetical protein
MGDPIYLLYVPIDATQETDSKTSKIGTFIPADSLNLKDFHHPGILLTSARSLLINLKAVIAEYEKSLVGPCAGKMS